MTDAELDGIEHGTELCRINWSRADSGVYTFRIDRLGLIEQDRLIASALRRLKARALHIIAHRIETGRIDPDTIIFDLDIGP